MKDLKLKSCFRGMYRESRHLLIRGIYDGETLTAAFSYMSVRSSDRAIPIRWRCAVGSLLNF